MSVVHAQLPHAVVYIFISSRDHASYKKDSGALDDVLKNTFIYLEPKKTPKIAEYLIATRCHAPRPSEGSVTKTEEEVATEAEDSVHLEE
jgi:hypothetical protein